MARITRSISMTVVDFGGLNFSNMALTDLRNPFQERVVFVNQAVHFPVVSFFVFGFWRITSDLPASSATQSGRATAQWLDFAAAMVAPPVHAHARGAAKSLRQIGARFFDSVVPFARADFGAHVFGARNKDREFVIVSRLALFGSRKIEALGVLFDFFVFGHWNPFRINHWFLA